MKLISLLLFLCLSNLCFSQARQLPFADGESCQYEIDYGFINAGHAKYIIKEKNKYFQVLVEGGSNAIVDIFFKVRDKYETRVNKETLLPYYFLRDVLEGEDTIFQQYHFNHNENKVTTQKGTFAIPSDAQDICSAFFYYRSLSSKELTNKETFYANMFVDEKNYKMKISFLGKEIIKTPIGKVRCLKFSPDVIVGRMFKNQDDLTIWISDDKNHILVKLETGILVGSVDVNLQSVKNIKFPLSITE